MEGLQHIDELIVTLKRRLERLQAESRTLKANSKLNEIQRTEMARDVERYAAGLKEGLFHAVKIKFLVLKSAGLLEEELKKQGVL